MHSSSKHHNDWFNIFTLTILSAYFHIFMEWLFFATKPSSISPLSFFEKAKVMVISSGIYAFFLIAGFIIVSIPVLLLMNPKWKARISALRFIPSALMLSVTALTLLDNFTYTLFKIGIVTTTGVWRIIYILIFILTVIRMFRFAQRTVPTLNKIVSILSLSLLALSTAGILAIYFSRSPYQMTRLSSATPASAEQPNIIILGADGLSAEYLSAYGHKQDTTPFLNELAKTSLIAENAFSNASSTTASTTSALTGKEPANVNVYRYPDVLTDEDSFEHLPRILKYQGYTTVQIGVPYYVDAEKLNLLDGFDFVNGNSTQQPALDALRSVLGNSPSTYFLQTVSERVSSRLLHVFFLQMMNNPFEEVNNPKVRMSDADRAKQVIQSLKDTNRPLFIFAHFMDTHGPAFSSTQSHSSANDEQEWDVERYKDAIRSFDDHVREIYLYLAESGKLDNTILVIYTDHGYKYVVNQRVPIIVHFPNGEYAGTRKNNVEVVDIPVTLLDYLGISNPAWMTGLSMLNDEPPAKRAIISVIGSSPKKVTPPFYQIKSVQVIVCQKWYVLNVQENTWRSGKVNAHTTPCDDSTLPPDSEIRQMVLEYLEDHGFDVASLK